MKTITQSPYNKNCKSTSYFSIFASNFGDCPNSACFSNFGDCSSSVYFLNSVDCPNSAYFPNFVDCSKSAFFSNLTRARMGAIIRCEDLLSELAEREKKESANSLGKKKS